MYHTLFRVPSGFEYGIYSMKSRKKISPVITRYDADEYVLLNGLYLFIIDNDNETIGWLKSYLKVNYGFEFQIVDGVYVAKFLVQNGTLVPLKFKGSLKEFWYNKAGKTKQD